jgi:hypothetical protein
VNAADGTTREEEELAAMITAAAAVIIGGLDIIIRCCCLNKNNGNVATLLGSLIGVTIDFDAHCSILKSVPIDRFRVRGGRMEESLVLGVNLGWC